MKEELFILCDRIHEASFALHTHLRHGHTEKVYENGLANRLKRARLPFPQQHPLKVYDDDGTVLGDFNADLLVDTRLLIELKACRSLADEHTAQLLGDLRASRLEHDLLINFGAPRLEIREYALAKA